MNWNSHDDSDRKSERERERRRAILPRKYRSRVGLSRGRERRRMGRGGGTSWQGLQDGRARTGNASMMKRTANVVHRAVVESLHSSGLAREVEKQTRTRTSGSWREREGWRLRAIRRREPRKSLSSREIVHFSNYNSYALNLNTHTYTYIHACTV